MSDAIRHFSWVGALIVALAALGMCSTPVAGKVGIGPAIIAPRPPLPPGPGWVWVPPEYKTVYERVWVAERTERVPERVWVPEHYEYQPVYDSCGGFIGYRYVLVSGGYYETRWREVVVAGHWDTVAKRVLVREGYWKRVDEVVPPPPPVILPGPVPSVGVEGYKTPTGDEGKGPFTPLREWPEKK